MLAHASGLQREPPGEIWESLTFPDEEELLAGLEEAEQVLPPMAAWHYSNLAYALLGHRRRAALRHALPRLRAGAAARAGRPGADDVGAGRERPRCRTSSSPTRTRVRREPVLELGGKGGESGLYSTVGDLARWGAFLCDPDESVLAASSRGGDARPERDGRDRLDARLGPRDRALAARRADLRRPHRRLPGLPLDPRLLAARPGRRGRC